MENREIPNGWRETTLGEVADIVMGQSPKGESYNTDGDGIPFYQGVTEFNDKYVAIKTFTNQPTKIVEPNTILFSVRAPVGRVNFTKHKSCIGRGNAGFTIKNGSQEFLYYLLINIENYIQSHSSGTVFSSISGKELKEIKVTVPSTYEEQVAIGQVLSSLDEKIELLEEENKTLETLAQTIFTEWFVNFNFPGATGEMEDSELGEIPKGWRVGKLGEVAEIASGKRPKNKEELQTPTHQYPLIGATKIMGYVEDFLYDSNTLIIGRVGTHGEIQKFYSKIWPSDNTLVIKTEEFNFVYFILSSIDYEKINRGAVQPLITQTDIKNYPLFIPEVKILFNFKETTNPLFEKIKMNAIQIQTLKTTRDTLLPKLTSGEIRVEGFGE